MDPILSSERSLLTVNEDAGLCFAVPNRKGFVIHRVIGIVEDMSGEPDYDEGRMYFLLVSPKGGHSAVELK